MYQPYNNPYVPQMPYGIQPQPMYQQSSNNMAGKVVNDFTEVTANDVPMNGNQAVFVKSDGSEIQVRKWNNMGTIDTTTYKPFYEPKSVSVANTTPNSNESDISGFGERLEGIELMLASLNDKLDKIKPNQSRNVKKEVSDE